MPGVGLGPATLFAIFLESIFYGVFMVLWFVLCWVVLSDKSPVRKRWALWISSLMMTLSTTHIIVSYLRMLEAYTPNARGVIDPAARIILLEEPLYKIKVSIFFFQTMLGDSIMIWRCWVIYGKLWWILVPGVAIELLDLSILIVRLIPPKENPETHTRLSFIPLSLRVSFLAVTLTLHMICTTAIVTKIMLTRRSIRYSSNSLSPVIIAIVESAAVYTLCVLLLLIFNVVNYHGEFVTMDIIVPLVGVVFCLIILRLRFYLNAPVTSSERGNASSHWQARQQDSGIRLQVHEERYVDQYPTTPSNVAFPTKHHLGKGDRVSDDEIEMDVESADTRKGGLTSGPLQPSFVAI